MRSSLDRRFPGTEESLKAAVFRKEKIGARARVRLADDPLSSTNESLFLSSVRQTAWLRQRKPAGITPAKELKRTIDDTENYDRAASDTLFSNDVSVRGIARIRAPLHRCAARAVRASVQSIMIQTTKACTEFYHVKLKEGRGNRFLPTGVRANSVRGRGS